MKRILIVDDEENIGRSLRLILEREGFQVAACRSGAEFRAHPDRSRADVFLLDVRLPDASGIDLLRELRRLMDAEKFHSLALPRLATGVGGLNWDDVSPLITKHLGDLQVPVYVYVTFHKGVAANEPE